MIAIGDVPPFWGKVPSQQVATAVSRTPVASGYPLGLLQRGCDRGFDFSGQDVAHVQLVDEVLRVSCRGAVDHAVDEAPLRTLCQPGQPRFAVLEPGGLGGPGGRDEA